MKKIFGNNKILYTIIALIILAGIIVAITIGFNKELEYDKNNSVMIYLGTEFKIEDIKEISKEVLKDKKVSVKYVEEFKDTALITTTEITEEEKTSLVEKINEKYTLENTADSIEISTNSRIRLIDILKQYIVPFLITSITIILYFIFMYRKVGVLKVLCTSIIAIIVFQVLLFSIIAITRFPVGRYTLTLIIAIYMISMVYLINKFEKEKSNIKVEKK